MLYGKKINAVPRTKTPEQALAALMRLCARAEKSEGDARRLMRGWGVAEKDAEDGSFKLVYLGDGETGFRLELTWLKDRTQPYDLGEQEFHLALLTDRFDELLARHRAMGCVCFENPAMGIYFIEDPDGYWIEIVPEHS